MLSELLRRFRNTELSTSTPIEETPHERAERKLSAINDLPGDEPGEYCPLCKGRGYVAYLDEQDRIITRDCTCMVQRRVAKRIKESGLESVLDRCTFDTWVTAEKWQQKALEIARRYAAEKTGGLS